MRHTTTRRRQSPKCYLCGSTESARRPGIVRDNASLQIRECRACGLVFLSSFRHIGKDFYQDSGMHAGQPDIASWCRDTRTDDLRRFRSLAAAIKNRKVLDFGCGNGGFLRQATKSAACAEGFEIERGLKEHHKALGLVIHDSLAGLKRKYDLITAFHVIEHLRDPAAELRKLARLLGASGQIIIEVPNSADAMLTLFRCKAFSKFTYWSCHLYLFNSSTLRLLARKAGLKLNFIRHIQRYPLSNHLHWLAKGKPDGHRKWRFLNSPTLNAAYEKRLAAQGLTDTVMASFS